MGRAVKQVWISRVGEPSVLEVRERPDPEPGPGQVRIAVEAAGVNFADLMARMGVYPDAPPLPAVVGYEVAGTIEAVGVGGDRSRIGTSVVAGTPFGGYSDKVVVDSVMAVPRPEGMDAATGASIPVTGLTAWMMCEEFGRVREGDRVLIHSAGGGVGLMALDLVKWRGATAVGTASAHKHEFLKERGYDELIDYRTQDYFRALQSGPGFDLVLDPVGGGSWEKGLDLLRPGGKLVCFGFSANASGQQRSLLNTIRQVAAIPWVKMSPIKLINENKAVCGVNMGRLWQETERMVTWLEGLMTLAAEGRLRPHVHAQIPFSQAAEAHRLLHARENLGKVVLVPDAVSSP